MQFQLIAANLRALLEAAPVRLFRRPRNHLRKRRSLRICEVVNEPKV